MERCEVTLRDFVVILRNRENQETGLEGTCTLGKCDDEHGTEKG